jgi:hypothetical protein
MIKAVPYCLTQEGIRETSAGWALPAGGIGPRHWYEERRAVEIPQSIKSDEEAAEYVWTIFQNISADHKCPDGGRSLMMGDLVRVGDNWLVVEAVGFKRVNEPSAAKQ